MSSDIISRDEAARILAVTPATVDNWLRLGKLVQTGGGFLKDQVMELKSPYSGFLKSRRNKSSLTENQAYFKCIDGLDQIDLSFPEALTMGEIRCILTEAALRLFSGGKNRLDRFLSGRLSIGRGDRLILDLINGEIPTKRIEALLSASWVPDPEKDVLGFIYLSLLPLDKRRRRCAYYTPAAEAGKTVSKLPLSGPLLDACCGSGAFMIAAAKMRGGPKNLFGLDSDPVAVCLARLNLYLRYRSSGVTYLYKNIVCKSFFDETKKYPAIAGNPPWGGRPEVSGRFLLHAARLLKNGGRLAFILPQSLFSAKIHSGLRRELFSMLKLTSVDYLESCFYGVFCPSMIISAENSVLPGIKGCVVNSEFTVNIPRPWKDCLNLRTTDEDFLKLEKMKGLKNAVFLRNNSRFALGIVTGRNRDVLFQEQKKGSLPVIRGTDVSPFLIKEPQTYMFFDKNSLQQCAPPEIYSAKEKIVYSFIGRRPKFAVDRSGRLTLNSCNIIIPEINGLSIDYITAVLNSEAVGFFLEKSFAASKWLRWHLESVPIPFVTPELQREICSSPDWNEKISELYFG